MKMFSIKYAETKMGIAEVQVEERPDPYLHFYIKYGRGLKTAYTPEKSNLLFHTWAEAKLEAEKRCKKIAMDLRLSADKLESKAFADYAKFE